MPRGKIEKKVEPHATRDETMTWSEVKKMYSQGAMPAEHTLELYSNHGYKCHLAKSSSNLSHEELLAMRPDEKVSIQYRHVTHKGSSPNTNSVCVRSLRFKLIPIVTDLATRQTGEYIAFNGGKYPLTSKNLSTVRTITDLLFRLQVAYTELENSSQD